MAVSRNLAVNKLSKLRYYMARRNGRKEIFKTLQDRSILRYSVTFKVSEIGNTSAAAPFPILASSPGEKCS